MNFFILCASLRLCVFVGFLFSIFVKTKLMRELASTIAAIILSPLNWFILFLVLAAIIKRRKLKRIAFIPAILTFIAFGSPALLNLFARKWQPAPVVLPQNTSYSFAIVPGGFASPDEKGNGYFNSSSDRFIQAVRLFKSGKVTHLLIAGGNGKRNDASFREAAWVKKQLMEVGIPDSVIFIEDRSNNTKENAINSKAILDSVHLPPPYVLITSALHMRRAKFLFEKAGLPVVPFPCNYTDGRGPISFSDFIPNPKTMCAWDLYLKEAVGVIVGG